ncbi:MAG: argininosuccinate lyase [Candidatus Lokiarchaeota archaeon]|nr:argininosuccinate lyase [Candidatus Lokiarchaeota archaeon]
MKKDFYRSAIEESMNKYVLNFSSSLKDDIWIIYEDIIGTQAHNIMLFEQGIINKKEIKKILLSLRKIKNKVDNGEFILNEDFEDIHPLIEYNVIEDIGMDAGGKIHTGRSRNDQVSVDLRLKIRSELNNLSNNIFEFTDILYKLSKESIDSYMPLYTHLQRAQLGQFSHYINYYIAQILRVEVRINEGYKRINKNPLGACAIGGTSININRKRTTELLGFDGIIENSIDSISSRDYIIEILNILSLFALHLSRISEDLIIWATKEFDFIDLDGQFCSGSSVMPQKKNPDTLELIRAKSSIIISNSFKASMIIKAVPSGYFKDFQELKPILKESFNIVNSILEILKGIFSTMKLKKEKMIRTINESYILALDLAEILVNEYNIPFRLTHQIIGDLVRKSKNPKDLFDIEKIKKVLLDKKLNNLSLSSNFIESIKNLKTCLDKRISKGSPSHKNVNIYLNQLFDEKNDLFELYNRRTQKIEEADSSRNKIIQELIL